MSLFRHGLVVGKFYPPHIGHHHLIRVAASRCAKVTVVVAGSHAESIPLSDRVSWLRDEHADTPSVEFVGIRDDAAIDYASPHAWAAHNAIFDAALRSGGNVDVDAVFSGEPYGDELAEHHDATHVFVPRDTYLTNEARHAPVLTSGTACRADLAGMWDALAPATRAGLTLRVVFVGAESTGTTTVSRELAGRVRARGGIWERTQWVPEYGRQRSREKLDQLRSRDSGATMASVAWSGEDFLLIARKQAQMEEAAARAGSPLLIADTDAFATQIWERRYLGETSRWAAAVELPAAPRIYLVTDHQGVAFEQDGLRDGEHIREDMTTWFIDELTRTERSWVLLTGSVHERMDMAEEVVNRMLDHQMTFAPPLTDRSAPTGPSGHARRPSSEWAYDAGSARNRSRQPGEQK